MIFSAPRFVAIDNEEKHLAGIKKAFQDLGAPCLGVLYDPEKGIKGDCLRGVRCLFMDLHLTSGAASTDNRANFSHIAGILERYTSPTGGPFVLVVWTVHSDQVDGLRNYLDQNIASDKPHARPLAVLSLAKEEYIDLTSGSATNPDGLQRQVLGAASCNPQIAALLAWEADIMRAAGETLAELLNLVPEDQRRINYADGLDAVLSALAYAAVGADHVETDPRAAISTALAPILADLALNQQVADEVRTIWSQAVTRHKENAGLESAQEAGKINRMLHLALPNSGPIRPADWGAVVRWPFADTDVEFQRLTGQAKGEILKKEFKLDDDSAGYCQPLLVRVGAACDYAQSRSGPVSFFLGFHIPEARKPDKKLPEAIWRSPVLVMPGDGQPFHLYVHARFPQIHPPAVCQEWAQRAIYRIREQLLMHLISKTSSYLARPGIVELEVGRGKPQTAASAARNPALQPLGPHRASLLRGLAAKACRLLDRHHAKH